MFLRNCWYVAGFPAELCDAPLARRLLGEPIVLFRTGSGQPAALEDRCAHRHLPLSLGCVEGERLRCGYHGAAFAVDGCCVEVPGQTEIPPGARVRSYPVQERYGFVWVWMGDPARAADAEPCTMFAYIEQDHDWHSLDDHIPIGCSYLLVNDNLADVSHTEFVHASTLGSRYARTTRQDGTPLDQQGGNSFQSELVDGGIDFRFRANNTRLAPTFENGFVRVNGPDGWNTLDLQLDYLFRPPGFWIFRPTTLRSGDPVESGLTFDSFIVVTPETANTCHYFHRCSQRYAPANHSETQYWFEQASTAFHEDKIVLEAQQGVLGDRDVRDLPHVSFRGDRLGFQARKIIEKLIAAEQRCDPDTGGN